MGHSSTNRAVVERCWALVGRQQAGFWYARRRRPTRGQPASVEFDADWVLAREQSHGDIVGFYHTHPTGMPRPSCRDHRTMRAWVGSFGKPLLCLIEADRKVWAYLYENDESIGLLVTACQRMPRGLIVAYHQQENQHGK